MTIFFSPKIELIFNRSHPSSDRTKLRSTPPPTITNPPLHPTPKLSHIPKHPAFTNLIKATTPITTIRKRYDGLASSAITAAYCRCRLFTITTHKQTGHFIYIICTSYSLKGCVRGRFDHVPVRRTVLSLYCPFVLRVTKVRVFLREISVLFLTENVGRIQVLQFLLS